MATTETTEDDTTGHYNGGPPYGATEAPTDDSATTTTGPPGRVANAPAIRSGSGMPPGVYPVGPGTRTANSSPVPATATAPIAPVVPVPDPVVLAESQPAEATTSSTVADTADGNTAESPGSEVRSADRVTSESPAPPRRSEQLGQTGDGTRRLIIFGGVALLMGAVVVAFTGREGPRLVAAASPPVGPTRRPRPRQEIDGWEDGIPLAPAKRELARHRLGLTDWSYSDDESWT